jgi:hypothetical protein
MTESWRSIQLSGGTCSQDLLILDFFRNKKVKYVGDDLEFSQLLDLDDTATNLYLVINYNLWLSELISVVENNLLNKKYQSFYFGINRYRIIGNDTEIIFNQSIDTGKQIINLVSSICNQNGYSVQNSGYFDKDHGRYMNFIQPLTWVYGT